MSVTYQVRPQVNPNGQTGVDYAADFAVKTGDYTFDELQEDIEHATTATAADVAAVLKAARKYLKGNLLAGKRVVIGDLGALQIHIKGKCFKQALIGTDGFNPASYIKGYRVVYRPEAKLLKEIRISVQAKRIPSELMD